MSRLGGLLPILLGIAVCWMLSGGSCGREGAPQLVQVSEVAPREIEVGERLAIVGDGFPPGRAARVSFRGTLHRPGERPEQGAEIVAEGVVSSPQHVDLAFTEATQGLFCRTGDRTLHTTFEGDLEVAFAAAIPGAAPVAGVLRHVTLDVRPTRAAADRDREGTRLLGWLGVDTTVSASGLLLSSVHPGSRAEGAGLAAGDVIVSFDGVRVASAGDALPAPGEREASLVVRRDGVEVTRPVAVDGFRLGAPAELLGAAIVVFVGLALALLLGAPTWPGVGALLQRAASRLRKARPSGSALAEALPPHGPLGLVDAVACALLASMPFGQYLVASQLDVGVLFTLAAASLAAAALIASGSAWRGLRAAAALALQHVPAALAVVAVVTVTGSLRVREIAGAQGGWPWDWLAFRNPGALLALATLLESARIEPGTLATPGRIEALVERGPGSKAAAPGGWLAAACRAHHLIVAGLAAVLFLGGWLLPGLTQAEQDSRPILQLAGAAWLLAKTGGLVALVAWSRVAFPRGRLAESTRTAAFWLVPIALASLMLAAGWSWWSPTRAAQLLVSSAMVAAVVLVAGAVGHRIRHGVVSAVGDGHVSPFL